jgi:hypothetical protein
MQYKGQAMQCKGQAMQYPHDDGILSEDPRCRHFDAMDFRRLHKVGLN